MNGLKTLFSDIAILVDETFPFNYMYRNMFLNVRARNIIMKIKPVIQDLKDQIEQLSILDINNIFVVGDQEIVTFVVNTAQFLSSLKESTAWFAIMLDDYQPKCYQCTNFSILSINPEISPQILRSNLISKPYMMTAFYFEVTKLAIVAMKEALVSDLWDPTFIQISCDSNYSEEVESSNSHQTFDFLKLLQNALKMDKMNSMFADYVWDNVEGSYPEIHMNMNLVDLTNSKIISKTDAGSWIARINEPLKVQINQYHLI